MYKKERYISPQSKIHNL